VGVTPPGQALASKRLAADRRAFHEMVGQVLPYMLGLWQGLHTALLAQCGAGGGRGRGQQGVGPAGRGF
jgi:hypothetical protein